MAKKDKFTNKFGQKKPLHVKPMAAQIEPASPEYQQVNLKDLADFYKDKPGTKDYKAMLDLEMHSMTETLLFPHGGTAVNINGQEYQLETPKTKDLYKLGAGQVYLGAGKHFVGEVSDVKITTHKAMNSAVQAHNALTIGIEGAGKFSSALKNLKNTMNGLNIPVITSTKGPAKYFGMDLAGTESLAHTMIFGSLMGLEAKKPSAHFYDVPYEDSLDGVLKITSPKLMNGHPTPDHHLVDSNNVFAAVSQDSTVTCPWSKRRGKKYREAARKLMSGSFEPQAGKWEFSVYLKGLDDQETHKVTLRSDDSLYIDGWVVLGPTPNMGGYDYKNPPRHGQKWEDSEDQFLADNFKAGDDAATLARKHGRSISGILARLEQRKLVYRNLPKTVNGKQLFWKPEYNMYYHRETSQLFADYRELVKQYQL